MKGFFERKKKGGRDRERQRERETKKEMSVISLLFRAKSLDERIL